MCVRVRAHARACVKLSVFVRRVSQRALSPHVPHGWQNTTGTNHVIVMYGSNGVCHVWF